MTEEQANKVYDILVVSAGASERQRPDFVQAHVAGECTEYRFIGWLGHGGKYRAPRNRVDCYPEDSTPERELIGKRTNTMLKSLDNELFAAEMMTELASWIKSIRRVPMTDELQVALSDLVFKEPNPVRAILRSFKLGLDSFHGLPEITELEGSVADLERENEGLRADLAAMERVLGLKISADEIAPATPADEVKAVFHRMWSKAHDQPGYNKEDWMTLQALLRQHHIDV